MATELKHCRACSLRDNCKTPTCGRGAGGRVFCVLEHAGQASGVQWAYYEKLMRSALPDYHEYVWTTFQYKCPTNSATPTAAQRDACKGWLWGEIKEKRPMAVFTFGVRPSALLLRLKADSFTMDEVVGRAHEAPHLPGCTTGVVPLPSLDRLYRGSLTSTRKAMEILETYGARGN